MARELLEVKSVCRILIELSCNSNRNIVAEALIMFWLPPNLNKVPSLCGISFIARHTLPLILGAQQSLRACWLK